MARLRLAVLGAGLVALALLFGGWSRQSDPSPPATDPPVANSDTSGTSTEQCGLAAPPDAEFVGQLSSVTGNLARFKVNRVVQGQVPDGPVTVIYGDREEQFLRTGTTYRVEVIRTGFGYSSALTGGDCGNDPTTVYSDGSTINTSVLADTRGPLVKYAVEIVVGFLLLIGVIGFLAVLANQMRGDGDF